ncbi:MAG: ion channel, partial [Candidatus Latescibacteria bacterium]|nr:ion channel [Candidatus Latescibacterota bacterium]
KEGHLFGINLTGTQLFKTNLENANLKEARIAGADLLGANLNNTDLERVHWGSKSLVRNDVDAQKLEADGDQVGSRAKFLEAEEIYRSIRKAYEAAGTTDIAGDFFHREMVAKRKQMPLYSFPRFWSKLVDLLCGYGEIPYRVISSSFSYILFNALVFCLLGMQYSGETYAFDLEKSFLDNLTVFGYSLYYSVVTFTTLGYGDFTPVGWSRPFAAVEAFNGAFMIALFILAFVKKMTR